MENDKMKVVLKIDAEGIYFMERNGKPLTCPFAGRMLVPGNLAGSYGITERVCSSLCPLFSFVEFKPKNRCSIFLNCTLGVNAAYNVLMPDEINVLKKI